MESFEQQLEQVTELISLPEVYLKISLLMDDHKSTVNDFADVIRFDPNLSMTVLKVVNSAFYGFSGQIDSIARAVNMIGIGQLNIIALSVSAISALDVMDYPKDIMPLKTFWRHSLFSGVLFRQLGLQQQIENSEKLFVIGLLHEIGHLVLYTKFSELARQTIQLSLDNNIQIHEAEQQILGCHYGQIGAQIMGKWKLPADFQKLTLFQPTPQDAVEDRKETAILNIAHAYSHRQLIQGEHDPVELINPSIWSEAQLTPEMVDETLDTARHISADLERVILK